MVNMFTTDVELRALYTQKLHFKFTAVSADLLHSTWTYPEQKTDIATTPQLPVVAELSTDETNIICICSVEQGADIFRTLS
jgi:hypothetical protein